MTRPEARRAIKRVLGNDATGPFCHRIAGAAPRQFQADITIRKGDDYNYTYIAVRRPMMKTALAELVHIIRAAY